MNAAAAKKHVHCSVCGHMLCPHLSAEVERLRELKDLADATTALRIREILDEELVPVETLETVEAGEEGLRGKAVDLRRVVWDVRTPAITWNRIVRALRAIEKLTRKGS
jgi:hypothetical protein